MTTAIDTNVLVALWDTDTQLNNAAQKALDAAQARGALVISGPIYAELLALPGRTEKMLDEFVGATGIFVEWQLSEQICRTAGKAFQQYVQRRSKNKGEMPRRIFADLLIGAHAAVHHYELLTLDRRLYNLAFPKLKIVRL